MHFRIFAICLIASHIAGFASVASAKESSESCELTASEANSAVSGSLLPFSDEKMLLPLTIAFRGNLRNCAFDISMEGETEPQLQGSAGVLRVRVTDKRGHPISAARSLVKMNPSGDRSLLELVVSLVEDDAWPAGTYNGHLKLVLRGTVGSEFLINVPVSIDVRPHADIRMAGHHGGRGHAGLDFGALERGESMTALLAVRSNADYLLQVSSANGGRLVNKEQGNSDHYVGYSTTFAGQLVDLATPKLITRVKPDRAAPGSAVPLTVQIGETEGKPAGEYRDVIVVSVRFF